MNVWFPEMPRIITRSGINELDTLSSDGGVHAGGGKGVVHDRRRKVNVPGLAPKSSWREIVQGSGVESFTN